MPTNSPTGRLLSHLAQVLLTAAALAALVFVAVLIYREDRWAAPDPREGEDAFFHGSIGTEFAPLPVLLALPDLCPEHFHRPGGAGNWVEQFGFIRPAAADTALPLGFTVSRHRPKSGAPSPVPFVGIGCVTCHSSLLRTSADDPGRLVVGTGSAALNMFAFLDPFQAALLDERLTVEAVADHHRRTAGQDLGLEERMMVLIWLSQARATLTDNLPKFDRPFGDGSSFSPASVPTGPGRTQPFRTLVRSVLDRPGAGMSVYTKIAPVYWEDLEGWSQFDGSIHDLDARSSMAALAAGATVHNLALPDIAANVRESTKYTRTLRGPRYADFFPKLAAALAPAAVERGRGVYRRHCFNYHGDADGRGSWEIGPDHDLVVAHEAIGTDPYRVTFRYFEELPDRLHALFPDSHPFHFRREDLRPGPAGQARGYVNKPMHSMFSRAPYLHNASVLTLAELINLEPRRLVFYRGDNFYDPERAGLASPDRPDSRHYFEFDTRLPGNSNAGHDYPGHRNPSERC
jgi:hypothetical protein